MVQNNNLKKACIIYKWYIYSDKSNQILMDKTDEIKDKRKLSGGVRVMVFNATFNNISVISWRSILLVDETGVPGENHRPVASHLSRNVVSTTPCLCGIQTHNVSGDRH